jgi:hypothetical protein
LPPAQIRVGDEVKEYLSDSLLVACKLGEALRRQVRESDGQSLAEVADRVVAALPKEWGFRPAAEVPAPNFSLGTVAFAMAQFGKRSAEA